MSIASNARYRMREVLLREPTESDLRIAGAHFPSEPDGNGSRRQEAIFEMSSGLSFRFSTISNDEVQDFMQAGLQAKFDQYFVRNKPIEIWMANPDGADIWRAVGA